MKDSQNVCNMLSAWNLRRVESVHATNFAGIEHGCHFGRPCLHAVFTGALHYPWTCTARRHGPVYRGPVNTARIDGRVHRHPLTSDHPWTRVCRGSVNSVDTDMCTQHSCPRAVLTKNTVAQCFLSTRPVNTCVGGHSTRVITVNDVITPRTARVTNTARENGCLKSHPCSRAVTTAHEHG